MKILQFLQDEKGQYSATRLAFLFWGIGSFAVWATVSIKTQAVADIKPEVTYIIGALMTGKVWQRFAEAKTAPGAKADGTGE